MRLVYNGVDMQVIETHEFVGEPVYDDTGTDYLYTRYSITVRAIINGQSDIFLGRTSPIDAGGPRAGTRYQNGPVMSYMLGSARVNPVINNLPNGGFVNATTGFRNTGAGGFPGDRPNPFVPTGSGVQGGYANAGDKAQAIFPTGEPGTTVPTTQLLFTVVPAPVTTNITHTAVRYRLTTPRGQLFVFSGPLAGGGGPVEMMLASPDLFSPTDAKNGPIPRLFSITQALGDANTLMVDFSIETYVNESGDNGGAIPGTSPGRTPPGLVSNRFSQIHTVGPDGYTSVSTIGTAIFRTDLLNTIIATSLIPGTPPINSGTNPDVIRDRLFMPIPVGFVRENITVIGLPDATGVRYQYTDVQQAVNFPAGYYAKAASISAVHRQALSRGDVLKGVLATYERVLGIEAQKNFAKDRGGEINSDLKELVSLLKVAATVSKVVPPP